MQTVDVTCIIIEGLNRAYRHGSCLGIAEAWRWGWVLWEGQYVMEKLAWRCMVT